MKNEANIIKLTYLQSRPLQCSTSNKAVRESNKSKYLLTYVFKAVKTPKKNNYYIKRYLDYLS